MSSRPSRLPLLLAVLLLVLLLAQLLVPVFRQSVTVDEFAHVPSGLCPFEEGRFDLYSKNPPLVKSLAALPVLLARPEWKPLSVPAGKGNGWAPWVVGTQFFYNNVERYDALFARARLVVVALTLALALLVYRFCLGAFGVAPALVTLALISFCPNLVAHGSLATVDVGAALFAFLAVVAVRRFVGEPSARTAFLAGLSLGFALLAKYSSLVLVPALAGVAVTLRVVSAIRGARYGFLRELGLVLFIGATTLAVVNAGYAFHGSLSPIADLPFESRIGRAIRSLAPDWLPSPVPRDFALGLDGQVLDVERGEFSNYLGGEWSEHGWWYYYLYALLVKSTIPLLLVVLLRFVLRPRLDRDDAFLLVPALAYLLALSFGNHLQVGLRYLLPALPLLYASVGRVVEAPVARSRLGLSAIVVLLVAHAASACSAFPRPLSFFNAIAGGPKLGYRHLLDSKLDWGQELPELAAYLKSRGNPSVKLAYFGHVDPARYGIRFEVPEEAGEPHHGLYAISANYLMGYPYLLTREGKFVEAPRDRFAWLREYPTSARVGDTFFVFEIP